MNQRGVAVMNLEGVIFNDSDDCTKGLDEYSLELNKMGSDPNVLGVVLSVNSPGGEAVGPESFGLQIAEFKKKYKKPIAGYIRGKAASAAYGIISNTDTIFVSSDSAMGGSIGTMATLFDDSKRLEMLGLREIVAYAEKSFNKNSPWAEAVKGNTQPLIDEILNPLNERFISAIERARGNKLNTSSVAENNGLTVPEIFTGKVYFGQDLITMGLADKMGGLDAAINYVHKEYEKLNQNKNIYPMATNKTSIGAKIVNGLFGLFQKNNIQIKNEQGEPLTEEQVDALAGELDIKASDIQEAEIIALIQKEVEAKNLVSTDHLEATIKTLNEGIALKTKEIEAKNAELEKKIEAMTSDISQIKTAPTGEGKQGNGTPITAQKEGDDSDFDPIKNQIRMLQERGFLKP
jgi:protease-4